MLFNSAASPKIIICIIFYQIILHPITRLGYWTGIRLRGCWDYSSLRIKKEKCYYFELIKKGRITHVYYHMHSICIVYIMAYALITSDLIFRELISRARKIVIVRGGSPLGSWKRSSYWFSTCCISVGIFPLPPSPLMRWILCYGTVISR